MHLSTHRLPGLPPPHPPGYPHVPGAPCGCLVVPVHPRRGLRHPAPEMPSCNLLPRGPAQIRPLPDSSRPLPCFCHPAMPSNFGHRQAKSNAGGDPFPSPATQCRIQPGPLHPTNSRTGAGLAPRALAPALPAARPSPVPEPGIPDRCRGRVAMGPLLPGLAPPCTGRTLRPFSLARHHNARRGGWRGGLALLWLGLLAPCPSLRAPNSSPTRRLVYQGRWGRGGWHQGRNSGRPAAPRHGAGCRHQGRACLPVLQDQLHPTPRRHGSGTLRALCPRGLPQAVLFTPPATPQLSLQLT